MRIYIQKQKWHVEAKMAQKMPGAPHMSGIVWLPFLDFQKA